MKHLENHISRLMAGEVVRHDFDTQALVLEDMRAALQSPQRMQAIGGLVLALVTADLKAGMASRRVLALAKGGVPMSRQPAIARFMRRQQVAFELGISRHTLSRMLKADATFPRFFEITPGIEVVAREDFDRWLRERRLKSLEEAL